MCERIVFFLKEGEVESWYWNDLVWEEIDSSLFRGMMGCGYRDGIYFGEGMGRIVFRINLGVEYRDWEREGRGIRKYLLVVNGCVIFLLSVYLIFFL